MAVRRLLVISYPMNPVWPGLGRRAILGDSGRSCFDRLSAPGLSIDEMGFTSFPSEIFETFIEKGSQ
jgi:hypothetical protein